MAQVFEDIPAQGLESVAEGHGPRGCQGIHQPVARPPVGRLDAEQVDEFQQPVAFEPLQYLPLCRHSVPLHGLGRPYRRSSGLPERPRPIDPARRVVILLV